MKYEFVCEDCDASYDVIHNEESNPVICPFCGWMHGDDDDQDDEDEGDWDEQDRDRF